jgi:hypothetical protein
MLPKVSDKCVFIFIVRSVTGRGMQTPTYINKQTERIQTLQRIKGAFFVVPLRVDTADALQSARADAAAAAADGI